MATKKKLLQAAAGTAAAGGAGGLNVEQVFSTYVYEGNGSSQTIQNGVNLGQSYGSGSARFGGTDTGEYLQTPVSTDFQLGNGDFTVEFFMNVTSDAGNNQEPFSFGDGTGAFDFLVFLTGGNVKVYMSSNGSSWDLINGSNAGSYTIGKWHHVAVTRSSAGVRGFVDGVQGFGVGTSATIHQSANQISIGRGQNDKRFNGYISDFHFIKGTEKYSTNFTPPTSALTAHANTKLLTLQQDTLLTDNSTTGHTITEYGGSIYDEPVFGPYDAAEAGEGGLVWVKRRDSTSDHELYDTERGATYSLSSNATYASILKSTGLTSFNSSGFTVGSRTNVNASGADIASWTFRKAPKFFDVVTYTGDGVAGREIAHNLGAEVGMMIIKSTSLANSNWVVYHRSNANTEFMYLNGTVAKSSGLDWFSSTTPSTTTFTVNNYTNINGLGETFVAYLFAHNDGDGEFGPDGDADIIKCGTCSGETGSNRDIDLGFEPQFIITKAVDTTGDWRLLDNMRGWLANPKVDSTYLNSRLEPNTSDAESGDDTVYIKPNGFYVNGLPGSGDYIYIAIRRGPMAVPESADDVFAIDANGGTSSGNAGALTSGFPVDLVIYTQTTGSNKDIVSRLNSTRLQTNLTNAENTSSRAAQLDFMDGYGDGTFASDYVGWMWKRAPSYFDVVAYTGNGTAGRTVSHNLGVAPEMIWIKSRSNAENWQVGHKDLTGTWNRILYLNRTSAESSSNAVWWNNTAPTSEVFSVGTQDMNNGSGLTYIAYLFASLDGVSKVGSFSHTFGTDTTVDCGFSSGARFVIVKRSSDSGDWMVFDTERGIVAGNDARLLLNSTAAEATNADNIDPNSSGFVFTGANGGGTYIFYAVA